MQTAAYWQRCRRLAAALLAAWLIVTLLVPLAAPTVWMASQGSLLLYLVIAVVHAQRMDRIDREHAAGDEP